MHQRKLYCNYLHTPASAFEHVVPEYDTVGTVVVPRSVNSFVIGSREYTADTEIDKPAVAAGV